MRVTIFPSRIFRSIPKWADDLKPDYYNLLREVYAALQSDSARLATMGARTLVDLVMNDTVGDVGGFGQKLAKMVAAGALAEQNAEILAAALEAGNAAAHRGHRPDTEDLMSVMDIVENLLQTLILREKAAKLKRRTPRRKRK